MILRTKNKNNKIKDLEYRLEKLITGQNEQFQIESLKSEDIYTQCRKEISDLEIENKKVKKEYNEKINQLTSSKAILEQRVTFLEQEKLDFQQKLADRAKSDDSIITMIQKRYEEQFQEINKDFIENLATKDSEINELKESLKKLKEFYEEELKSVNCNNQDVAFEYTSRLQEFEKIVKQKDKKIEEQQQKIIDLEYSAEDNIEKHREDKRKEFEEISNINDTLKSRIHELEKEVQAADQARKSQTFKMNSETEEKINQIKEVYEAEKKQFQNKLRKNKDR